MIFALLALNILLGALCLVVARRGERSRALRLWGTGLLCYAIGLLTTLLTVIPVDIAKVVGNTLIAISPVFTVAGLLEHTEVRLHRGWIPALRGPSRHIAAHPALWRRGNPPVWPAALPHYAFADPRMRTHRKRAHAGDFRRNGPKAEPVNWQP